MASEKDAAGQDNDEEDDSPSEDFPEGDEEVDEKKANSLTGILNAKIAALAVASLVIGILIGQVALPGLGVGLVSLPSADGGNGTDTVDMAALQVKVQGYIQKAVDSQGLEVEVKSIESYNDSFYNVNFTLSKDGEAQDSVVYLTKDGLAIVGNQPMMLDEPIPEVQQPAQQQQAAEPPVVGQLETFTDSGYEVELQDGKPVIRLFSTTWCPHCIWVKPTFDRVAKEYADAGKIVAYHWEIDTKDDTLTEAVETAVPETEMAVYAQFNPSGSIPVFVLGGRYYRTGNGFEGQGDTASPTSEQSLADLVKEEAALRAVIDKLIEEAKQ
ncbi:MAG: protein disulfide isomerase family protein [archaeon]